MNPRWQIHKGKRVNQKYESWIRTRNCLVCNQHPVECHHVSHQRSDSYSSVPLCIGHHRINRDSYHRLEHNEFEKHHAIDLNWEIRKLLSEYIEENKK